MPIRERRTTEGYWRGGRDLSRRRDEKDRETNARQQAQSRCERAGERDKSGEDCALEKGQEASRLKDQGRSRRPCALAKRPQETEQTRRMRERAKRHTASLQEETGGEDRTIAGITPYTTGVCAHSTMHREKRGERGKRRREKPRVASRRSPLSSATNFFPPAVILTLQRRLGDSGTRGN